jgi:hypothetical protein
MLDVRRREIKMDIKPHATLTRTLRVLLKITIGVTAFAVLAGFYDFYSYSTLPSDVDANEVMLPSDAVTGIVGLVQVILAIITGITFLRWIYRSNKNLRALSGESMAFTPGWSVGWYFIPIANLWKPYQVMKEIWNVSHKGNATDHGVLGWWWALWLISNFLRRLSFKLVMRADDASSYAASSMTFIISDGLDVILNVVALVMVTRIGIAYSQNIVEHHPAPYPEPPTVQER